MNKLLLLWVGGILIGLGIGIQIGQFNSKKEIASLNFIIKNQDDMLKNKCGIQ